MMSHYFIALGSLPQRLPQQKAAGNKEITQSKHAFWGPLYPRPRHRSWEGTDTGKLERFWLFDFAWRRQVQGGAGPFTQVGAFLVRLTQAAVTDHVGDKNCGKAAIHSIPPIVRE